MFSRQVEFKTRRIRKLKDRRVIFGQSDLLILKLSRNKSLIYYLIFVQIYKMLRTKGKSPFPNVKAWLSPKKACSPIYCCAYQLSERYQGHYSMLYSQSHYGFSSHPKGTPNPQGFTKSNFHL